MKKFLIGLILLISIFSFSEDLINQKTHEEYSKIASILSEDILNNVNGNIVVNITSESSSMRYYEDYKNEYSGSNIVFLSQKSIPFLKYSPTAFLFFTFSIFDVIKNLNSDTLYFSLMIPLGIDFYFLTNPISLLEKNKYIDSILLKNLVEENVLKKKNIEIFSNKFNEYDYKVNIYIHNITQNIITNNYGIASSKEYNLDYVITMEILNKNNQKVFQKSYSKSEIIDKKEKFNILGFLTDLALFGTGLILLYNTK
ncbi:hypothetical protein [Marinitoga lauensis]|uniref:hypothetical protein n=1 Tax=Marinitoga lauensis TaxID=2201189 RepID=UPI001012CDBF|nr:hypothetical protein [Marinitoga lauensis]